MICLTNVSKSWDGGRTFAVKDLSLTIEDGSVLALLGGSGCGKSTTVKMINRLIEPTSGRIEVSGQDVMDVDPVELRRHIGYVFQGIGLFPHMTVSENVGIGLQLLGQKPAEYLPRVEELLDLVSLPAATYASRMPDELSGGQRQRIGFARALATRPQVMLLDEPFGALDPVTRDELQQEFSALQRQLSLTVLLVTHDMAEALLLADQIAVMNEGRVLRVDTPARLLADPGDDYVTALLEAPKRHGELVNRLANAT